MEFRSSIFNAARDGKLKKLKTLLELRPWSEVSLLVSAHTEGATPLVMAAKNGHLSCVEYLLERCNADIEQVGSVVFDGETIDGAPPLWCAAAAGHLTVVAYLLSRGGNVNATTRTNSTPLRAACFDGHFEIVQFLVQNNADIEVANRHGHTCLMIACYKGHYDIAKYLIDANADVNRKSVKGNTALHDCAESGSLEILKLLLDRNAKMDVDSYGMTPLLAAAVTGHTDIVEYLISRTDIVSPKDKIDSLELLGATFVDKKRDMLGALKFWKIAMEERYRNGVGLYPKPVQRSPVAAYENCVEVTNMQLLREIISDPDEMRMQALLVRERILGPAHPDTSYYIRYRGAVYADTGNFERCITLWMYALEMQQKILEPLSPMTQSSFVSFAELFSFMMSEATSHTRRRPIVNFRDVFSVFDRCMKEVEFGINHIHRNIGAIVSGYTSLNTDGFKNSCDNIRMQNSSCMHPSTVRCSGPFSTAHNASVSGDRDLTYFHRTLVITLHLVCLLTKLSLSVTKEEKELLRRAVYRFVRLDPRGIGGVTPLHLACSRDSVSVVGRFQICGFPSLEVTQLLIEVGANPNAVDLQGNTPLHTLAQNKQCRREIVTCLLSSGAHLDSVNDQGETFASLRQLKNQPLCTIVNSLKYSTLQCLAARVIRASKISYASYIHPHLKEFVDSH